MSHAVESAEDLEYKWLLRVGIPNTEIVIGAVSACPQ